MKECLIIYFLLIICNLNIYSQIDSNNSYTVNGTVVDGLTNDLLIGANIIINNANGTKTDENGEFSLFVKGNDTIKISFVGFKTLVYIFPSKQKNQYLTKFKLYKDSISLSEIAIFPWPSYPEFKKAFLAMDKQNEQIKMKGVNLYQDRNITPPEFHLVHLFTNPISFIYDKLFDKKAKLKRKLDRRRDTRNKSTLILE